MQVARRLCVDFHRKRKPTEPLAADPPARLAGRGSMPSDCTRPSRNSPTNYREAIVLYYLDGRKCSSVAASLGIAEPAVRQRLVRARAMLHDLLQEDRT